MKKLMLAAITAAVTGGVFAAPEVFDYKASVKYLYLKTTSVKYNGDTYSVYTKFQKSAKLTGYLIQDVDGVTSTTISGRGTANNDALTAYDFGRNRSFLGVMSSAAESAFKQPKILPAVLDAKFIDTNFKKAHTASTGLAEGTLFVGGEAIAPVRPQLDYLTLARDPTGLVPTSRGTDAHVLPAVGQAGMFAYADYVWTSCFLLGRYNGPNYFYNEIFVPPFADFELAWDRNLPETLQVGFLDPGEYDNTNWRSFFHDTWMNGAGIGKYIVPGKTVSGDVCCGLQSSTTTYPAILSTLTGSLKGGIFICTDNGIDSKNRDYRFFDQWDGGRAAWDSQFFSGRLVSALGDAQDYAADKWQFDLWQDGSAEQETTDVIFGNWAIKRTTKLKAVIPTNAEVQFYTGFDADAGEGYATYAEFSAAQSSRAELALVINSAVKKLKASTSLITGEEIYNLNARQQVGVLPVLTPAFVEYYGL